MNENESEVPFLLTTGHRPKRGDVVARWLPHNLTVRERDTKRKNYNQWNSNYRQPHD